MEDNEVEQTISKFVIKDCKLYLKIIWKELSFHMRLYRNEECWLGAFSNDLVKSFSSDFDETEKKYFDNVRDALIIENKDFLYEFNINSDKSAEFIWMKKFADSAVMKYGSISLSRDLDVEAKDSLVDFLVNENTRLLASMKEYINQNNHLNIELEQCKKDWEEDVKVKLELERNLYGKFVNLLNTKKKRIQILEECIRDCE